MKKNIPGLDRFLTTAPEQPDCVDSCALVDDIYGQNDALRTKLEMAEARCKSALDLYEGYHDRNIELRAEIAAVKAEQDWHSVDDADNLVRCLCLLGISTERYSVCGQQWPTSEFQRAVRHVLAGVPGLVERINADIVRKDAEIAALEELIAEIGLAHPIVVAARARLAALGEQP